MKYPQVMIDIETLAVDPHAAIIQIGAIAVFPGIRLKEMFGINIIPNLIDCVTSEETIKFHTGFNELNYAAMQIDQVPNQLALNEFHIWIKSLGTNLRVWSKGTDFDIPILTHSFKTVGLKPPWTYSNVRDFRTVAKLNEHKFKWETKNGHDALGDAGNQLAHLLALQEKGYIELE